MPHPEPDVEAFRSALARELASVSPRPGGWERVRGTLAHPQRRTRPRWMSWLLLTAPLLAAGMLTGALAAAAGGPGGAPAGRSVEAPPVVSLYGVALVAVAMPISLAEGRRLLAKAR